MLAPEGTDASDRVLAKSVAARLFRVPRIQAKGGEIAVKGKERGTIVWYFQQSMKWVAVKPHFAICFRPKLAADKSEHGREEPGRRR